MAETLTVFIVPVTTLLDEELAAVASTASAALTELLPDNPYAVEFADDLRNGCDQLNAAGVKELANPETGNRHTADGSRDRKYLGFRSRVENLTFSDDQSVSATASVILDKIYKRGYSMQNFGLKKQTIAMDGLILDLKETTLQQAMNRIGINQEFEAMVSAEEAYRQVDSDHARAGAEIENPSLVAARKHVRTCIEECNGWLASRLRKEPQVVDAMVRRWNEICGTITAQARARDTKKSEEKKASAELAESKV